MGTWATIANAFVALGQFLGLVRKAREALAPLPSESAPIDAAAQRAGTEAGAAATSAGRRAGHERS